MSTRAASIILLVLVHPAGCGVAEFVSAGSPSAASAVHLSFLYGRITTVDNETYRGGCASGGTRKPSGGTLQRLQGRQSLAGPGAGRAARRASAPGHAGVEIGSCGRRQMMVRFGDIAAIKAGGRDHVGAAQERDGEPPVPIRRRGFRERAARLGPVGRGAGPQRAEL